MTYHYCRSPKRMPQKEMYGVSSFIPQILCTWASDKWALKRQAMVPVLQKVTIRCEVLKASALSTILAHFISWSINWTHHHNYYASLEGKTLAIWTFLTRYFPGCNIILGNGLDQRIPWHGFSVPLNPKMNPLKTTAALKIINQICHFLAHNLAYVLSIIVKSVLLSLALKALYDLIPVTSCTILVYIFLMFKNTFGSAQKTLFS